jgi:hypothetical protein
LLNDGSKHINILDWRTNTTLIQRVEMGRRHSRRGLLMTLPLAKTAPQKVSVIYYIMLMPFCVSLLLHSTLSGFKTQLLF